MPGPSPPPGVAAGAARRGHVLRRLSPHPLSRNGDLLKAVANVDGASRGNPGPAGYGARLRLEDGQIIDISGFLGVATNNVAEYAGLLDALEVALEEKVTDLEVISDSLLLVNQMLGTYKVKHPNLQPLYRKARFLASKFGRFAIRHTLRAGNKEADRLANVAVDRGHGREIERRLQGA